MKKFWRFSMHFAERYFDRIGTERETLKKIVAHFNKNVLQEVFHAEVYGDKQRVKIAGVTVCYIWDREEQRIIVTTVY